MSNIAVSLAILKSNWDSHKDYLDSFTLFVVEALNKLNEDVISISQVYDKIEEDFCIKIPKHVLKTIFKRLKRKHILYSEQGVYRINRELVNDTTFDDVQLKVLEKYKAFVHDLSEYVNTNFEKQWSGDLAEKALNYYLKECDSFHKQSLSIYNDCCLDASVDDEDYRIRYYVAKFINHLIDNDSKLELSYLEDIIKGNMLAESLYFGNPNDINRRIKKTKFFLDTPELLKVLGYEGLESKDISLELVYIIKELGGRLYCYDHIVEEVRGILNTCSNMINRGHLKDAYGMTLQYFINNGIKSSDIEIYISNLERNIKTLGIIIYDQDIYGKYEKFSIDHDNLKARVDASMHYRNKDALDIDVTSINKTMMLRSGKKTRMIEECNSIIVTDNISLFHTIREFYKEEIDSDSLSPLIIDYQLMTLLWLKKPLEAPKLPLKRIISDSMAALQPPAEMWKKYTDEINILKEDENLSTEDYLFLRYTPVIKEVLIQLCDSNDEFVEGTIKEILEYTNKIKIKETKDSYDAIIEGYETELHLRSQELYFSNTAVSKTFKSIKSISKAMAKICSFILCSLIAVGLIVAISNFDNEYLKVISYVSGFILILMNLLNLFFGVTLVGINDKLVSYLQYRFQLRLCKMFSVEDIT